MKKMMPEVGFTLLMSVFKKSNISHFGKWFTIPEAAPDFPNIHSGFAQLTIQIPIPAYVDIIAFEDK